MCIYIYICTYTINGYAKCTRTYIYIYDMYVVITVLV